MSKNNPLVSIIIPVYNTDKYLSECLDSLLAQTWSHFEAICVNDGSTDKSLEILRSYQAKDTRFVVIDTQNQGASEARNTGFSYANGEYVIFLDSDDLFESTLLESAIKRMEDNVDIDFVHFPIDFFDNSTKQTIQQSCHYKSKRNLISEILSGRYSLWTVNIVWRKKLLEKHSVLWQKDLKISEDKEFAIRMILSAANGYWIDCQPLVHVRKNISSSIHKYSYNEEGDLKTLDTYRVIYNTIENVSTVSSADKKRFVKYLIKMQLIFASHGSRRATSDCYRFLAEKHNFPRYFFQCLPLASWSINLLFPALAILGKVRMKHLKKK